jgi:hypothetical protein
MKYVFQILLQVYNYAISVFFSMFLIVNNSKEFQFLQIY